MDTNNVEDKVVPVLKPLRRIEIAGFAQPHS
jgi:hypothetical protein